MKKLIGVKKKFHFFRVELVLLGRVTHCAETSATQRPVKQRRVRCDAAPGDATGAK